MGKHVFIYTVKINRNLLLICALVLVGTLTTLAIPDNFGKVLCVFRENILSGMVIVVDPGHGGIDSGAHDRMGLMEKDINLDVSLRVKKILESRSAKVIMTRDRDVSLEDRSDLNASRYRRDLDARKDIINRNYVDVFVSIHVNISPGNPGTRGAIVFYNPLSTEGKKLARYVAKSIDDIVYRDFLKNSTLYTKIRTDDYYILRETKVPGVLVELGFLTNPQDKKLLQDKKFKDRIALAISEGVTLYLTSY
jgi:N-acetylmuramoyl-L-alanine amidase